MYVFYRTTDNFKFIFYTFGITLEMIAKREAGRIATHAILNLLESGIIPSVKEKLLKIHVEDEVELNDEEFLTFCVLVDFTSRCFLSDIFSSRLRLIHQKRPFNTGATFDEIVHFYISYATVFFETTKADYSDDSKMLEAIKLATDWEMNDNDFI